MQKLSRIKIVTDTPGARLKQLRERAGMTHDYVSRQLDMALTTYSSYEAKKRGDALLPVPLVKGLLVVLVGRGTPAITREELIELAGTDVLDDDEEEMMRAFRRLSEEERLDLRRVILRRGATPKP